MVISGLKRCEYWNHFIERWAIKKQGGGNGVTGPKLARIKAQIMRDDEFWLDVVARHGGIERTPEQLEEKMPINYEHCAGNFWGMIHQTLTEKGLMK